MFLGKKSISGWSLNALLDCGLFTYNSTPHNVLFLAYSRHLLNFLLILSLRLCSMALTTFVFCFMFISTKSCSSIKQAIFTFILNHLLVSVLYMSQFLSYLHKMKPAAAGYLLCNLCSAPFQHPSFLSLPCITHHVWHACLQANNSSTTIKVVVFTI